MSSVWGFFPRSCKIHIRNWCEVVVVCVCVFLHSPTSRHQSQRLKWNTVVFLYRIVCVTVLKVYFLVVAFLAITHVNQIRRLTRHRQRTRNVHCPSEDVVTAIVVVVADFGVLCGIGVLWAAAAVPAKHPGWVGRRSVLWWESNLKWCLHGPVWDFLPGVLEGVPGSAVHGRSLHVWQRHQLCAGWKFF